ncbi:MAG: histidine decarboxylase [Nanoarchaeota archaeon]|nr:histidine decarboxylase [Nanoarchaeota archaeon]
MDLLKELKNHKNHNINKKKIFLGYPINLDFDYSEIYNLFEVNLNLLGNPFDEGARYKYERGLIEYFGNLYQISRSKIWGYTTSGGSEGNMYGLYVARERLKDPLLFFSRDTHYSIEKAADMLKIPFKVIESQSNGEINYASLEKSIKRNSKEGLIINLNVGSTMKGAIDNPGKIQEILQNSRIKNYYIHADAAFFGGYLPFLDKALTERVGGVVDSLAISGHKFFGTPFPCGIFLAKSRNIRTSNFKEYTKSHDVTLLGSRSGHSAILLWYLINKKGTKILEDEAKNCIDKAKYLVSGLRRIKYPVWRNDASNIVYFRKPVREVLDKWILAVDGNIAHVVTMQHVTQQMLDKFIEDISKTSV